MRLGRLVITTGHVGGERREPRPDGAYNGPERRGRRSGGFRVNLMGVLWTAFLATFTFLANDYVTSQRSDIDALKKAQASMPSTHEIAQHLEEAKPIMRRFEAMEATEAQRWLTVEASLQRHEKRFDTVEQLLLQLLAQSRRGGAFAPVPPGQTAAGQGARRSARLAARQASAGASAPSAAGAPGNP